jgi:hypothetical protein
MRNPPIWSTTLVQLEDLRICRGELPLLGLHQVQVNQQLFISTPPGIRQSHLLRFQHKSISL